MRLAALIVRDSCALTFAGVDLARRAEQLLRRAGAEHVQVVDDDHPFADAPVAEFLLVLPERVIVEPAALTDLLRPRVHGPDDAVVLADADGNHTHVVLLSRRAVELLHPSLRVRSAVRYLDANARVRVVRAVPRFIASIRDADDVPAVEAAYQRHMNGGAGKGVFTKNIRGVSMPTAAALLRQWVRANEVTLAGVSVTRAMLAGLSSSIGM